MEVRDLICSDSRASSNPFSLRALLHNFDRVDGRRTRRNLNCRFGNGMVVEAALDVYGHVLAIGLVTPGAFAPLGVGLRMLRRGPAQQCSCEVLPCVEAIARSACEGGWNSRGNATIFRATYFWSMRRVCLGVQCCDFHFEEDGLRVEREIQLRELGAVGHCAVQYSRRIAGHITNIHM